MPTQQNPLVSILTVVFNDVELIEPTLESIVDHCSAEVEAIVIDGGSTDGTWEVVQRYEKHLHYTVSESDDGIYDAMNKGVKFCRGSFVLHVNSGDLLMDVPVHQLRQIPPFVDCASFRVKLSNGGLFEPRYNWQLNFRNTLHHQGTFYKRSLLGTYDLRFPIYADHDFNIRMKRNGIQTYIFPEIIAFHDQGGLSSKLGSRAEMLSVVGNHGRTWFGFHVWQQALKLHSIYFRIVRRLRRALRFQT